MTMIDYVVIEDDECGPSEHKRQQWDADRDYVVLQVCGYRNGGFEPGSPGIRHIELVDCLSDIDFYKHPDDNGEGGDWVRGTFTRVEQIPGNCTHLRQICRDMGLAE